MFLRMHQNNSGGYHLIDEKIGVGEEKFNQIAEKYGSGFYKYRACCGKRLSDFEWKDDSDLTEEIDSYDCYNTSFIHYKDSRIEKVQKD